MTLEELFWFTQIYEALKEGRKVTTRDINAVYELIPDAPKMKARNGKIKIINETFDKIATETLQRYLVDKQVKEQQLQNTIKYNGNEYLMDIHEKQIKDGNLETL